MDEPAGDRNLAQETPGAERRRDIGAENLDRDLTIVLVVVGPVDCRPPALAELALDGIPARESRLQPRKYVDHHHRVPQGDPQEYRPGRWRARRTGEGNR
jgi:hypothetical protein